MDFNTVLTPEFIQLIIDTGVKLFGIVFALFYLFFSIIVIRQVQIMRRTVRFNDLNLLLTASYFELGLALFLVYYSLFIL